MRAAVQIAEAIESLDGQGQGGQQRHDEQTVGVVMAEMFEAVAILGIVEPLVLDLPTTLRQSVLQWASAQLSAGKIRQPESFDDLPLGWCRATFYAHFDNKEDLLVSGFDGLRASLKERQREALLRGSSADERVFAFSHEMFARANEYRDVFRAMVGKRSGAVVEQLLHNIVLDLVRDDVKAMVSRGNANSIPTEALVQFVAGGLFGLLEWWLDGKMRLSVKELNTLFRRLAIPAMKAALR